MRAGRLCQKGCPTHASWGLHGYGRCDKLVTQLIEYAAKQGSLLASFCLLFALLVGEVAMDLLLSFRRLLLMLCIRHASIGFVSLTIATFFLSGDCWLNRARRIASRLDSEGHLNTNRTQSPILSLLIFCSGFSPNATDESHTFVHARTLSFHSCAFQPRWQVF